MSRIPAPGAIVGTTTISAVLALCLLGGVSAQAPAAAGEPTTDPSTIGATLIAAANTATVVGLPTTTSGLSDVTMNPAVMVNAANAATSESAGTAASIDLMQTLGLAGGVASEQVPASLAKKVAAPAPKPVAAAITGTPLQIAQIGRAHV